MSTQVRSRRAAVFLILLIAAGLRFWSLGAGIPNDLNIDEPQIMSRSVQMMKTGEFNPHFFDYPGLYLHLQVGVASLRFLYGATRGDWASLNDVAMEDFFLWGRAVTALFGTATVLLVYLIGLRWNVIAALSAAALLAVMPSPVRESHFILTDTPTTFFVTATLLLTLRAHQRGWRQDFALAGAMAGLAAATKYNGGLVVIVPILAAVSGWIDRGTLIWRSQVIAVILGGAACAFLLAAPYTVLALPEFLNGFAHLATAYTPRPAHAESGALIYLKHLRLTLGTIAFVLTAGGLLLTCRDVLSSTTRARSLCLLIFPIAYVMTISDMSLIFGRYLLPVLPFAALLAGVAIGALWTTSATMIRPAGARTAAIAAFVVVAFFAPARQAIGFNRAISVISTSRLAYEWIAANVQAGASVAIEGRSLMLPTNRYRVRQIPRLSDRPAAELFGCYDYVVASSQSYGDVLRDPQGHLDEHGAYAQLFLKGERVASFHPSAQQPGSELMVIRISPRLPHPDPCP